MDSQAVSPDGRWYLCSNRWDDCLLAEVGGKRSYRYPSRNSDCYRHVLWMADGRRWLENFLVNGFSHRLVLHDVANPKLSTAIPLADKAALYGHLQAARDPKTLIAVVNPNDDIGYNTDGSPPAPPTDPRFVVTRFGLQDRAPLIAQYHVMPPHGSADATYWVSPQGDRIAWQVTTEQQNPMLALAHRIIPSIQAPNVQTIEFWVSEINGGNMHELGLIESPLTKESGEPVWLNVEWLPGDRTLSFEYDSKLYTITAD